MHGVQAAPGGISLISAFKNSPWFVTPALLDWSDKIPYYNYVLSFTRAWTDFTVEVLEMLWMLTTPRNVWPT